MEQRREEAARLVQMAQSLFALGKKKSTVIKEFDRAIVRQPKMGRFARSF